MPAFIPSTAPGTFLSSTRLALSFRVLPPLSTRSPARRARTLAMASSTAPPALDEGMFLFAKAGPGGDVLGDCPFTWKANLALRFKKADFKTYLIDLANKPDWFLDLNENGSTPTLVDGPYAIGDSDDIVEYSEKVGKDTELVLTREDDPKWDAAFDAVSPIFGALVRFLKNKEPEKDAKVTADLADALKGVDKFLSEGEGPFLLGKAVSALDCNLAPKLQHSLVAATHYKGFEVPAECTHLQPYMDNMRTTEEWKASACTDDVIIWGWSKFF